MARKQHIVKYTDKELRAMQERGESKSNWAQAAAMTDAEIDAAIAGDADEAGMVVDWSKASVELPQPKAIINMCNDDDIM